MELLDSETVARAGGGAPLSIGLLSYRSHRHCGGQGVYVNYLSRALVEAGHSVDVISGPPYPELDSRVRLVKLPSLDMFGTGRRWSALGPGDMGSLTNVLEWLGVLSGGFPEPYTFGRRARRHLARKSRGYDVIHDNQSLSYGLLDIAATGLPVVATVHHPITIDLATQLAAAPSAGHRVFIRRWHGFLRMQMRVARRLDHLLTISEASRQAIARDFAVPARRMAVVPNGIDLERFAPRRGAKRHAHRIMATASADAPLKGLAYLLRALAILRRSRAELELLVVGEPRQGGNTARLIRELGLGAAVRFEPGVDHDRLVELYAEATLAVVPSLYEGFGFPAGEAMSCGVPLVATTGGALPEVVGDAGVLVPPADEEALAAAIGDLLDRPERRRTLGLAGRRRVAAEFSWPRAAARTVEVYRRAIGHADG